MSIKLLKTKESNGISIKDYLLENSNGAKVEIISYGARIHDIIMPDINGNFVHVTAGLKDIDDYFTDTTFLGTVVGRVANRIGGSKFTLNGKEYLLNSNEKKNHLHGGIKGFDKQNFESEIVNVNGIDKLKLTYFSKDGEENYPGNLTLNVYYTLSNDNALNIEYEATCDADTVCNFTNHCYFNLSGDFKSDILGHELYINSDSVTDIDNELIPNGKIVPILDTALDFTTSKIIGKDINNDLELLKIAGGYDFNYIINDNSKAIVKAVCKESGISMEVYTDMPCVQLYTGNFIDNIDGRFNYKKQWAFCLETQKYPNACNIVSFPSVKLNKGERYYSKTVYKFGLEK